MDESFVADSTGGLNGAVTNPAETVALVQARMVRVRPDDNSTLSITCTGI